MRGGWCASLLAAMVLWGVSGAHAAEKVDCSRISLEYESSEPAEWSECYRLHKADAPDGEGAESMAVDYEIFVADFKLHTVHLVFGDTGANTYFIKQPASAAIGDFDELEGVTGTESEEKFKRYQIIRFQASLWKTPVHCIGFVKYGGGAITQGGKGMGAATLLEGYDCWRNGAPDRSQIEASLSAIDD
jgi:hypothetical protein